MSNPLTTPGKYRAALVSLGEMARSRKTHTELRAQYDGFRESERVSAGIFPAFGTLCDACGLDFPEAMCVAAWFYQESTPVPPLTVAELTELCRYLGKRPPSPALGRLFAAYGGTAVLHPVAADFLLEREPRLPEGFALIIPQDTGPSHAAALYDELSALLDAYMPDGANQYPLAVALCGDTGSGRKFLIERLCLRYGAALLTVGAGEDAATDDIALIAGLYGAFVCVSDPPGAPFVEKLAQRTGFVFMLCRDTDAVPVSSGYMLLRRDMPEPDAKTRETILRSILGGAALELDTAAGSALGRLGAGQIKRLALRVKAECAATGRTADKALLLRILREEESAPVDGAIRLECSGTLCDLVLPPELTRQLTELCTFIKSRDIVYKHWGFYKKVPWGRGISALFYGAPGTGKTMAAAVLANETGLPLLRVDIAQLFSKYIGETQKNLEKIFKQASRTNCILFFDEADALFAKRSDGADAQDKYANAETAYLLQRIEMYDGVCILATNLLQNFDEAFRRRIGYMLRFPMPDAAMRERIWRGVFPDEAPVGAIDYGLLAQLELSGASIKNSAVHGAYLAALSDTPITMECILEGVKNEYQKQGRTVSPQLLQIFTA